jgi:hypothetical protein
MVATMGMCLASYLSLFTLTIAALADLATWACSKCVKTKLSTVYAHKSLFRMLADGAGLS